ncbi:MAG: DNA ligase D [Anaeromyxobacteraceae bacterium]
MRAREAPLPAYEAQLATLVKAPPAGVRWIHEIKYDGYRIGCRVADGAAQLFSRRGREWTRELPELAAAAAALPVRAALLDGEACVVRDDGRTSFEALQAAMAGGARGGLVYFAFDLLHLDGEDLAARPLEERKARLRALLDRAGGDVVRYADHFEGDGATVLREACRLGLEGIVSKRRDLAYRPGRDASWCKAKCLLRQELVVVGWLDQGGSPSGDLGSILVGVHRADGTLALAGRVGTGFGRAEGRALRARLAPLEQEACPLTPRPTGWLARDAHWTRPSLVVEVAFAGWTGDGKVRHPSLRGVREDVDPASVVREEPFDSAPFDSASPAAPLRSGRTEGSATLSVNGKKSRSRSRSDVVAGVRISHPARLVDPASGTTKLDLARYYDRVADAMLPHLLGRPLTLFHCPEGLAGECRFMKHSKQWAPEAVRRVRIQENTKLGEYLVVESREALVSLAQMDVVELHTWNSRVGHLEEPDRIVVDLDPGPRVAWGEVVAAARTVRDALTALGLTSFVKSTGGVGLHVVVPLVRERPWTECLAFARAFAATVAAHDPRRYTTAFAVRGREDRILLDYLRNNRTNTSAAAFSARARPGLPVSVPLAWEELDARRPPAHTVASVPRRLAALAADPWRAAETTRQRLRAAALRAVQATEKAPARREAKRDRRGSGR